MIMAIPPMIFLEKNVTERTVKAFAGWVSFVAVILSGCASQLPPESPKWAVLENDLAAHMTRREVVRSQLTMNPMSPDAPALSAEIANLNRLVTANERALSYAVTEPVTTEPVPIAYSGPLPSELRRSLKVAKSAWEALSEGERTRITEKWNVELLEPTSYGFVIDSQVLNESTAGTSGGANLGSAVAQSAYIDRSFKSGNQYSATNQLALGLVGAIVGSSLDRGPVVQYRTRYSVRLADGSIQMTDEVKGDPFRLPVSMCVQFPSLDISDQTLCTQTSESLRRKHLVVQSATIQASPAEEKPMSAQSGSR